MPQNDRNSRNRKRRRAYDQTRDDRRGGQSTQRRSSAGAGSELGTAGTQGIPPAATPLRTPIMTPMRPAPAGIRNAR